MTAAEEDQVRCSRCGCDGYLHREDEVVHGCQLAELRSLLRSCRTILDQCGDVFELECGPERIAVKKCRTLVKQIDEKLSKAREQVRATAKEEMRLTLLNFGWTETIYGTFQAPGVDWHARVWKIDEAYARVTGVRP
jgi:hypothetical protein